MPAAADHLPALDLLSFVKAGRVRGQMRVIILPLRIVRALVDRNASTALAEEQLFDGPIRGRNDRRTFGGHDIVGVMTSPAPSCGIVSVDYVGRLHTNHGDCQAGGSNDNLLRNLVRWRVLRLHRD